MITLLGLIFLVVIGLDAFINKWAICKSVGALFTNAWKKVSGKL